MSRTSSSFVAASVGENSNIPMNFSYVHEELELMTTGVTKKGLTQPENLSENFILFHDFVEMSSLEAMPMQIDHLSSTSKTVFPNPKKVGVSYKIHKTTCRKTQVQHLKINKKHPLFPTKSAPPIANHAELSSVAAPEIAKQVSPVVEARKLRCSKCVMSCREC